MKLLSPVVQKFSLPGMFWRGLDFWGRHQRYWWYLIGLVTVLWLGYDVGRVVTRADLVRMGGASQGVLTIGQLEEKARQHGGGRLLVTGPRSARFVDANGAAWDVPDFGLEVNRGLINRLKEERVAFDGGIDIELTAVKTSASDVVATVVFDILVKVGFIAFYAFIVYITLKHLSSSKGARFRRIDPDGEVRTRIADVAGFQAAKQEVLEIVDYLKDPSRYQAVGARPPRGVLMYGPPGNGKTLLAKAVAGEAKANFIEQSASSFVQVYAGEGAKAVRRLFEEARKKLPCVIFIDEIDAMGEARSMGMHGEHKQTLNALLTEMDGFSSNEGIVVIAATNRLEVLDEALVRPGRFDRKVHVALPSRGDRLAILKAHAARLPRITADLEHWATQTRGFSGASLASLVNEAAIEAARAGLLEVSDQQFAAARDRVMLGARDASRKASPRELEFVAHHELGHALLRLHVGGVVEKVSIQPRGRALGVTVSTPEREESMLHTEQEIQQEILVLMGGRAAEEVFCDAVTTGAADDMARASALARQALLRYGFNGHGPYVPENQDLIREMEEGARSWVASAYAQAVEIMKTHRAAMAVLVPLLLENEEVSGEQIRHILASAA